MDLPTAPRPGWFRRRWRAVRPHLPRVLSVVAFIGIVVATLWTAKWTDDGSEELWRLSGQSATEFNATHSLPSDIAGYIYRDCVLMAMVLLTLVAGTALPAALRAHWPAGDSREHRRRPQDTGRRWRVALTVVASLGYFAADRVETLRLEALWMTRPITEREATDLARWNNAKWLLLAAATLLVISLWNRRLPRNPNTPLKQASLTATTPEDEWAPSDKTFGISISGGGVRSASFALGAIAELESRQMLGRARYVTSVSGGSYATLALEHSNRKNPPETAKHVVARLRPRLNYLIPGPVAGIGALVRVLLGLMINLWILYLLIFIVVRPVGWLIGTPLVQEGLRVSESYVIDVVHPSTDPDSTVATSLARCSVGSGDDKQVLETDPDQPPTIETTSDELEPDGTTTVRFVLGYETQCVAVKDADGDETFSMFEVGVAEGAEGVLSLGEDGAKIIRQPTVSVTETRHGADIELLKEMIEIDSPTFTLTEFAKAPDARTEISDLLSEPEPLTIRAINIVDRRGELDIDLRHTLIGFGPIGVAVFVWLLGGYSPLRRKLRRGDDRIRPKLRALPAFMGAAAIGSVSVFIALPWLVKVLPEALTHLATNGPSADQSKAISWLPTSFPPLLAWPILALVTIFRFVGQRKTAVATAAPTSKRKRNAVAFASKVWHFIRGIVVGLVLVAATVLSATTILTVGALNGPFKSHAWISSGFDFPWPPDLVLWALVVTIMLTLAVLFPASSWSIGPYYRSRLRWGFAEDETDERGNAEHERSGYVDGKVGDGTELVVCCAANLLNGTHVPTGRRAVSFTSSRSWIGGPELGWVPGSTYRNRLGKNRKVEVSPVSMTALSGAAVSPAMGKQSLGPIGSLLAVLNVRLGGWLPHPSAVREMAAGDVWNHTPGWPYFIREVLRRHRHSDSYVYVTDGGHWENLGLVEAMRRGCNTIVAISAAGDGAFSHGTFAEAVEIARTDLGIEFQMDDIWKMRPVAGDRPDDALASGRQYLMQDSDYPEIGRVAPFGFAYGTFLRPDESGPSTLGRILLIDASMVDGLPIDVHSYSEGHHEFPDVNTGDQFFTDRDFESYRILGRELTKAALAHAEGGPFQARVANCDRTDRPQ